MLILLFENKLIFYIRISDKTVRRKQALLSLVLSRSPKVYFVLISKSVYNVNKSFINSLNFIIKL